MEPKYLLTILEVITKSSEYLERKGVQNHKIDAEWLVAYSLKCKRMELYLRYNEVLEPNILEQIKALVMQRGRRIPLQHILGEVQFAGLCLKSDSRALVPRCETEYLVDFLLTKLTAEFNGRIADLGCGSGAILLSLCKLMPDASGCGYDNSENALSLANENLVLNNLCDRINFKAFDWNSDMKLGENFDLIVSNPPYLTVQEWTIAEPEVKIHDPRKALVAEKNGFSDIERIIAIAKYSLNSKGFLALEFGCTQADDVKNALSKDFNVEIIKDQFLVRRFAFAVKK